MSKRKTKEYIRIILSIIPSPAKDLKFDIPKEGSSLEEYLSYRWKNCVLIVRPEDIKHVTQLNLKKYNFHINDESSKESQLIDFLRKLEADIFTTKKKIWEKRFKYICPLLVALVSSSFTFILSKIFK